MTQASHEKSGFESLGISSRLLQCLDQLKFKTPTPIQNQSIPTGIEGKDIIGIAQTGTGKTLAYGIPLIERLQQVKSRALILIPTRELAHQVNDSLQKIASQFHLKTAVLIGGESFGYQFRDLRGNPRIIIATPGRLMDHLRQGSVRLDDIKILVLDEADRMLDMGFAPQINQILKTVPKERQTLLFSATMPLGIVKIASSYMKLPVRIEVAPQGTAAEQVEQEIIVVKRDGKPELLESILKETPGTVLIFSRTKFGAKKICHFLAKAKYKVAEIHSDRSQGQRREALHGFKTGKYQILVATDIAARGIDVSNIALVINFDLPDNSEDYVHRIGRTGRAGQKGKAISFATPDQRDHIRSIERLIRKNLPISPRSTDAGHWSQPEPSRPSNRRSFSPRRRGGGRGRFR